MFGFCSLLRVCVFFFAPQGGGGYDLTFCNISCCSCLLFSRSASNFGEVLQFICNL